MAYSYPGQPNVTGSSSSSTTNLAAVGFSATTASAQSSHTTNQRSHSNLSVTNLQVSAGTSRTTVTNSSTVPSSTSMMAFSNQPGYTTQSSVFYPQATAIYRNATSQQHQQQHQQQQHQQQHQPQQHQQHQHQQQQIQQQQSSRSGQLYHGAANTFEQGNGSNFMWNSRSEQPAAHPSTAPAGQAPTPYRPSGSTPFNPGSLGYDHMVGGHVSNSLLFSGLDPLTGNANMFSRNSLSRSSPWVTSLPLENAMASSSGTSRSQQSNVPITVQPLRSQGMGTTSNQLPVTEKSRPTTDTNAINATPGGSAFNYGVAGLAPHSVAGSSSSAATNDVLPASLYGRHRGSSQSVTSGALPHHVSLPPPAHQGYGPPANHPIAHPPFSAGPSLNMTPGFGDFLAGQSSHPHHPLAEHAPSSALYQQLLQQHRQQEELLLRNQHPSMMLHQSGLLSNPAAYPSTFTSGLGLQQPYQGWL